MMGKKQFARIAKALAAFRRAEGQSLTKWQYACLIDQVALACQEDNAQFNYDKFTDACLEGAPCNVS